MVKTCISKYKNYNLAKNTLNNRNIRTFFQESIAIAIENEKICEIKTILNIRNRSNAQIKTMLKTLNSLVINNVKLDINERKYFVLKKIQWRKLWIGRNINDKKVVRYYHDNMLHYACRHGKLCVIDLLIDEGK